MEFDSSFNSRKQLLKRKLLQYRELKSLGIDCEADQQRLIERIEIEGYSLEEIEDTKILWGKGGNSFYRFGDD